jgi:two-component system NtrC family sensor kinase
MRLRATIKGVIQPYKTGWLLGVAAALFVGIVAAETLAPANVVVAYGFVLPILLIATTGNRRLMYLTVGLCILATYVGLFHPTKPGRFVSALINRSVVVGVLVCVAYFAMTREEHKTREAAAKAELALKTEHLLRANAQLVEVKDALSRSERLAAIGQLVASVAHEVGTPLHSIAWHVQALGEEPGATADQLKRIEVIDSQISRVVRIIEELLTSTRQRKPVLSPLSVDDLVDSVTTLMQPAFVGKGVGLRREAVPADVSVIGDAEQLQQVLINLLTNALAATNEGGEVQIAVETGRLNDAEPVPNGPPMVKLSVRDTGCGMPKEDVGRALEPFFTTKAIGSGTGLGLFLSRQIISAHEGALLIDSEPGKGTRVVVCLPQGVETKVTRTGEPTYGI